MKKITGLKELNQHVSELTSSFKTIKQELRKNTAELKEINREVAINKEKARQAEAERLEEYEPYPLVNSDYIRQIERHFDYVSQAPAPRQQVIIQEESDEAKDLVKVSSQDLQTINDEIDYLKKKLDIF
jgi:deoxyribodipyrimidine photolyase